MKEVVIAGYLRTAQSRSRPNDPARDWFCKMRADELLAQLLPELIKRTGIEPKEIDDFLCGSAMAGIHIGFMEIAQDFADVVLVGGMEHMTRVPMGGQLADRGHIVPNMTLFTDSAYQHWDMMTAMNMGLTAEKLISRTDFTREDIDDWGARSHRRAAKARSEGFFDDEILPIEAEQADGKTLTVDQDQAVREDVTVEGMADLKPAFKPDGVITAGNSSPLNAGATSMLLMAKEIAKKKGIKPLATIRSIGFAGVDPTIMGHGPVPASKKALEKAGLNAADIDFWEINEAFCIVALNCIQELGLDPQKVNVMGGGTAIGHPLGATGIRLTGTLARILNVNGGRYGCANACVGGGQGVATIIEREEYEWC
jgi:acetyl-CoA C-acetyltransferase